RGNRRWVGRGFSAIIKLMDQAHGSVVTHSPAKVARRRRWAMGFGALVAAAWGVYYVVDMSMPRIQVGDRAPDFTAVTQDGQPFRLADYLGQKTVVLYFYPRDNTSVCTAQACSFRDAYEDFV